jgi:hypothetical protein
MFILNHQCLIFSVQSFYSSHTRLPWIKNSMALSQILNPKHSMLYHDFPIKLKLFLGHPHFETHPYEPRKIPISHSCSGWLMGIPNSCCSCNQMM